MPGIHNVTSTASASPRLLFADAGHTSFDKTRHVELDQSFAAWEAHVDVL